MKNNTKENDLFLNIAANPTFSITNFRDVGLNASNTSLADENTYKNIPQIQENPLFQTDGKFDEAKFSDAYQAAAIAYNHLADETYQEDIIKQATFHRDDIFAEPEQRRQGPEVSITRTPNPLRQKKGIRRINLLDEPAQSIDEIAQTQKVWDGATQTWHDSPNDSFWTDFWDTRVMAQWDFDADEQGRPTTDKDKIVYRKGDLKLNENGTYYYENLNGREVYGRRVLSKLNTLTTDGSAWNKYDFFDSDDLEKSVGGTFMKNVAMIAPMFIPYVGAWYVGAGIATEVAKVGSVLGKMFLGSDNQFLSAVEGFTQSLEPTSSQYAQDHAWSIENLLNLTGDVFKQLYEQRWLFKYAPAILKGNLGMSEDLQKAKQAEWVSEYMKTKILDINKIPSIKPDDVARATKELQAVSTLRAQTRLEDYMKEYNKVGELISKAYMTGITVQSAYGEAKQQGASDMEAALLTLGYAAGEYAIINSNLGKWVLPELRMEKEQWKQIAKTLTQASQKPLQNSPKEQKVQFMKKLFQMGKDIAQANYSVGKTTLKATGANAIGEGIEETSEELLYDLAKSVSNLGSWLSGSDTRLTAWDDMTNRYGLSFVGGVIGGGVFDIASDVKSARNMKDLKYNDAYQQLVYMARNGKMNDFLNTVNKMSLGNKYLSATKQITTADGEVIWQQGTETDNQDLAAKTMLNQQAKMINDILAANSANISDDSFLEIQTLKDLRFSQLSNSSVAGRYLQDYNSICTDIIDLTNQLNNLNSTASKMEKGVTDQNERDNGEDLSTQTERSNLQAKLKEAIEKKDSYINGDRAPEYVKESIFEMSPALNSPFVSSTLIRYIESQSGKRVDECSKAEIAKYKLEYESLNKTDRRDRIHQAFMIFNTMNEQTSPMFADHSMRYYESTDDILNEHINILHKSINETLERLGSISDSEKFQDAAGNYLREKSSSITLTLVKTLGDQSDVNSWDQIISEPVGEDYSEADRNRDASKFLSNFIYTKINDIVSPIISRGYVNPEVRQTLLDTIQAAENYFYMAENEASSSGADTATYELAIDALTKASSQLKKLPHSPITEVLDSFALSITDNGIKFSKLLQDLDEQLLNAQEDLSTFDIDNQVGAQIDEALHILQAAKSIVLATRTDSTTIDNLFGYNSTVNSLKPEVQVAEIQAPIADSMIQDLEILENKLKFFQRLTDANNEQKLNEQSKTATNKDYITYRKLVQLADAIPSNWKGSAEFKLAIDSLTNIKELSNINKLNLTNDEKILVEKDRIAAEDAIYTLFEANPDKVSDPVELSKFINTKNFNIYNNNEDVLDSSSKNIDDNSFVWYLASRAAIRSTDFYNEFKQIIRDNIAPLPTQELAVYLGYASIANGSIIDSFVDAINESIKNDWKTLSDSEKNEINKRVKPAIYWDYPLDSSVAPRFSRVTFVEGIPGSGKTSAVFDTIVTLLRKFHPSILNNTWVGHATTKSAEGLANSLNLEGASKLDKKGLMKKISPNWHESLDANGNVDINDDMYIMDDEGILRSAFGINEVDSSSLPSIIFIDEVSRYTTFDLDLIERFAKKYGVPVIVAGDFDQTRAIGVHKIPINGKEVTNYVQLFRNNFVRTPKLGVSMRANNSQKVFNMKLIRSSLSDLRNNNFSDVLTLHYFQDGTGLYGDKVYDSYNYDQSLVSKDIDLMISTLKEGQKIGFIYTDVNTDIYKLLSTATYKDYIDWHEGTSAQGLENQYYIIDDSDAQPEQYWSDLYTGISRAMQGSIIMHTKDYNAMTTYFESVADTMTNVSQLPEKSIKDFSQTRKKLLEQVVPSGNPIKIVPRKKDSAIVAIPPVNPEGGLESTVVETIDDSGNPTTEIVTNDGLPSEEDLKKKTLASSEDPEHPAKEVIDSDPDLTKPLDQLNMILHTFNTFESGWVKDQNGVLRPGEDADSRIDSFNGLSKLSSLPSSMHNVNSYTDLIGQLRSTVFNNKDKAELVSKVKSILNLNSQVYATFAFKSSAGVTTNQNYGKFGKNPSEEIDFVYAHDLRTKEARRKALVLIVGESINGKNNDLLEIPLATLTSPLTMLNLKVFSGIKDIYNDINISHSDKSTHFRLGELRKRLSGSNAYGKDVFIKLLDLWNFTQNGIFFINDPTWTLAQNFKSSGPTMVNKIKGYDYEVEGFAYDADWISLEEMGENPGRNISSIMVSPRGTYTYGDSKVVQAAEPGQPFVLITDDISLSGDRLRDYYLNQLVDPNLEKKVKLVYVIPPKASFKSYFDNLKAIITKDGTPKNIGNNLTAFRMLDILMRQPGFKTSELNYIDSAYDGILEVVNKLAGMNTIKDRLAYLKTSVNIQGLNSNISVQQALQNYLLRMVYPGKAGGGVVFKPELLAKIEDIMKANRIDGIFYDVKYDRNSKGVTMVDAQVTSKYTIDGIPFMINGKVDSTSFFGNVLPMVESTLNKIKKSGNSISSIDNAKYLAGDSNINIPTKSPIQQFIENFGIEMDASVRKEIEDRFKGSAGYTTDEIWQYLKDTGHLSLKIGGRTYISQKTSQFEGLPPTGINMVPKTNNIYSVDMSIGEDSYTGEFNLADRVLLLVKVTNEPTTQTPAAEGVFAIETRDELSTFIQALKPITFANANYNNLKNATTVEEFNTKVNALPITPKLLSKIVDKVNDFGDGPNKEALQNLIDFLTTKLNMKKFVQQTEQSCPITIKVKF